MVTGLKTHLADDIFQGRLAGETPTAVAELFKALGDETRLAIVQMLLGKELCVCDVLDAFDMSQPTISHHLKILRQAGIVQDERQGKWIYYSLNPAAFRLLAGVIDVIQSQADRKERKLPVLSDRL